MKTLTLTQQSSYKIVTSQLQPIPTVEDELSIINKAVIIGTQNCSVYCSCVKCTSKLDLDLPVHSTTQQLSRCSRCNVLQVVQSCNSAVSVNVLFKTEIEQLMLKAYTNIVIQLFNLLKIEVNFSKTEIILLTNKCDYTVTYTINSHIIKDISVN